MAQAEVGRIVSRPVEPPRHVGHAVAERTARTAAPSSAHGRRERVERRVGRVRAPPRQHRRPSPSDTGDCGRAVAVQRRDGSATDTRARSSQARSARTDSSAASGTIRPAESPRATAAAARARPVPAVPCGSPQGAGPPPGPVRPMRGAHRRGTAVEASARASAPQAWAPSGVTLRRSRRGGPRVRTSTAPGPRSRAAAEAVRRSAASRASTASWASSGRRRRRRRRGRRGRSRRGRRARSPPRTPPRGRPKRRTRASGRGACRRSSRRRRRGTRRSPLVLSRSVSPRSTTDTVPSPATPRPRQRGPPSASTADSARRWARPSAISPGPCVRPETTEASPPTTDGPSTGTRWSGPRPGAPAAARQGRRGRPSRHVRRPSGSGCSHVSRSSRMAAPPDAGAWAPENRVRGAAA